MENITFTQQELQIGNQHVKGKVRSVVSDLYIFSFWQERTIVIGKGS